MVGDVVELVEVAQRDAAPGLLFVEEGLDQQRGGEDLVARRIEQRRARHVRRAYRLAFAAAQAVLDHGRDVADLGLFHDQRFGAEQRERRCVGVGQVTAGHQLALVEVPVWIDPGLIGKERREFFLAQKFELGDADAMFAGNDAVERARQRHDARDRRVGGLQHGVVVGVHRDIGVHVAVAGVHVQCDKDAAAPVFAVDAVDAFEQAREQLAFENGLQLRLEFGLPRHA